MGWLPIFFIFLKECCLVTDLLILCPAFPFLFAILLSNNLSENASPIQTHLHSPLGVSDGFNRLSSNRQQHHSSNGQGAEWFVLWNAYRFV